MDGPIDGKLNAFHRFMQTPEQQEHERNARRRSEEYQQLFSPSNIENLQQGDVESFLDWQGRWSSLFRHKSRIVSDMDRLSLFSTV